MEISFLSHANKTHFHKKGCPPSLILKVRVFGTRKWPIAKRFYLGMGRGAEFVQALHVLELVCDVFIKNACLR